MIPLLDLIRQNAGRILSLFENVKLAKSQLSSLNHLLQSVYYQKGNHTFFTTQICNYSSARRSGKTRTKIELLSSVSIIIMDLYYQFAEVVGRQ